MALTEIMAAEGGMAINQPIIHHLLNRIKNFNEWGQCIVLGLVATYKPASQQEIFNIMNLLDGRCLRAALRAFQSDCALRTRTRGMSRPRCAHAALFVCSPQAACARQIVLWLWRRQSASSISVRPPDRCAPPHPPTDTTERPMSPRPVLQCIAPV